MGGTMAPEKDLPLEDLKELKQKIADVLHNSAGSVKSWNSFPFEQVTFANYTADVLREQWKRLKTRAHRQCTVEQDMELVEATLTRAGKRRASNLPSDFPKKPKSAYALFILKLSKKGLLQNKDRFVEAGRLWRELDPEKKEKFFKKYKLAVQKHGIEVEQFRAAHPELTDALKTKRKANEKTAQVRQEPASSSSSSNKPVDPCESGFQKFILAKQEKYAKKYNLEGEDLKKKLKKKFDRLSAEKQQKWENCDITENGID
ncbi:hypothetical protein M514_01170 [Trichuris suis]|uniref:HMG box domain-containing protein n=1 Tax=Trichuris suis TaxID=68888 RepID=A0A085NN37_9BILA|nr:hypothetical protein M513_01170 [Trichuris suis]KFD70883.1 hypothetical protein M514_01170 [Trichuris suis]KHJ45807.1 HMG box [Trichuris suis]